MILVDLSSRVGSRISVHSPVFPWNFLRLSPRAHLGGAWPALSATHTPLLLTCTAAENVRRIYEALARCRSATGDQSAPPGRTRFSCAQLDAAPASAPLEPAEPARALPIVATPKALHARDNSTPSLVRAQPDAAAARRRSRAKRRRPMWREVRTLLASLLTTIL